MDAHAVATIVKIQNEPVYTESLKRVEQAFTQAELTMPALLHFSWHVADSYCPDHIQEVLAKIAQDLSPIPAVSTGLGIFTSEQPVLYLPVCKTRSISKLHGRIWSQLGPLTISGNHLYSPENWMPHITLAYEAAEADKILKASTALLKEQLVLGFWIDHLALIFQNGAERGILTQIPFGRIL